MKIEDYVVVWTSSSLENLENLVMSAIKDWRQPFGAMSHDVFVDNFWDINREYHQAMVKYETEAVVVDTDDPKKYQIIASLWR